MKTIEDIYAEMFEEHENVQASRRAQKLEEIEAANPYGCNQYGEGWKQPHNGKQSKSGSPVKKGDSSPAAEKKETKETPKKEEEKAEENEDEENEDDDNAWPERSKDYREWRHDIEEAVYRAFSRIARNGYVNGIYFDGENFHTDNQEGRATLLYKKSPLGTFRGYKAHIFEPGSNLKK